jgi:uncharacterized hydrophobic protein (TIGR00271 family)
VASEHQPQSDGAVRFSRVLGLPWLVALGATLTVGIGVYDLLGEVRRFYGSASAAQPYLVLVVVALPVVLTLAERAAVMPGAGGIYNLARNSDRIGLTFAVGWLTVGGYVSLLALLGIGLALHLNLLVLQLFQLELEIGWLAAGAIAVISANSLLGTRVNWKARVALIFGGLAIVLLFSVRAFLGTLPQIAPFNTPSVSMFTIVTALFSSMWGLYFILNTRDSVQRPTKTILPAMLLVVFLGGGLGALAAASLAEFPATSPNAATPLVDVEPGLALFPNDLVRLLYALFGLAINIFALSRTIVYGLRLGGELTRDGFLPERLQSFSTLRGTPVLPLATLSLLSILLVLLFSLPFLAGLAAVAFLWTVALVHIPDLLRARPNLAARRRPILPFHPLFPGLTVAIGIFLPIAVGLTGMLVSLVWVTLGALCFVGYARQRGIEVRRKETTVGQEGLLSAEEEAGYRVMVSVASPKTASGLIRTAARLAMARGGNMLVLKTLVLADQMPTHLKQQAAQREWQSLSARIEALDLDGVPVRTLVRLAPELADGILGAVEEEQCDLLLLGWEGDEQPLEMGRNWLLNAVVRYAKCDVVLFRGNIPDSFNHVLVPTAGGPHATLALQLAHDLAGPDGGRVELLNVVSGEALAGSENEARGSLAATRQAAGEDIAASEQILEAETAPVGILEMAGESDVVIIGASKEGFGDRSSLGGLPVEVGFANPRPTIVARRKETLRYHQLILLWELVTDPLPKLTPRRRSEVSTSMKAAAVPNIDFYVLIILASSIAALGLLQNSAAVIIGAMLVAPLMSPILATGMNMVLGDFKTVLSGLEATLKGATMAIVVGIIVVIISPIDEPTSEILARTEPNVLDLMVALASGAAAGYALSRSEVAAALPGVAISAALVPPLCVVGYGLATSDFDIASGSLLLFVTNLIAIILAAALTFLALGFQPERRERGELVRGLRITLASLVVIVVALGIATIATVREINLRKDIQQVFNRRIAVDVGEVLDFDLERRHESFLLTATVLNFEDAQMSPEQIAALQNDLDDVVGKPVEIDIVSVPASQDTFESADLIRKLQLEFGEAVAEHGADIVDLEVNAIGDEFEIESRIVVYNDSTLDESALKGLQEKLSAAVTSPVAIRSTLLAGVRADLDPIEVPTPTRQP